MTVYLIFRFLSNISSLVLCWVGLRSFRFRAPAYARFFAVLCIFEQVAEFLQWPDNLFLQTVANNAVVLAEMIVYGYIFLKIIHSRIVRWLMGLLITALLLRSGFLLARRGITFLIPMDLHLYADFIFLIPAFAYFREIFIFNKKEDLTADFTFWLVAGTMFYCAATIVFYFGLNYLLINDVHINHDYYNSFSSVLFIIANTVYIKAFLCIKK
jgi:hypothetical protein